MTKTSENPLVERKEHSPPERRAGPSLHTLESQVDKTEGCTTVNLNMSVSGVSLLPLEGQ